ncbi:MAG: hypothetical protein V7K67_17975 [Nostoc sp.]|uniref:hypothetical protein n=1 Tax=Nostoc sp. TaxID=1180 RepID=UPI002FF2DE28
MKTIEELKTRIKELSSQAVEFSKKATEVCLTDREQAKQFRQQAREASKRCQLEGRAYKPSTPIRRHSDPTKDRAKVEWVVRVPQGSTVKLLARHERAGVVRTELTL